MPLSVGLGAVITFMALLELWLVYDGYLPPGAKPGLNATRRID
jgi:hypothetical protein